MLQFNKTFTVSVSESLEISSSTEKLRDSHYKNKILAHVMGWNSPAWNVGHSAGSGIICVYNDVIFQQTLYIGGESL